MRLYQRLIAFLVLVLVAAACSDGASPALGVAQQRLAGPPVRISELHYDNVGADVGESIEVSGPAGTDLTGWTVVLYNGSGGANYSPLLSLSGTIPATCGDRGVVVVPAPGLQNGAPDGIALVRPGGVVVEFLSYEGTFIATAGAASGLTSSDIGVAETGSELIGQSLARNAEGTWNPAAPSTFGACNDGDASAPAEVASIVLSPTSATILEGTSTTFSATALDGGGNPMAGTSLSWASSNPAVATVNGNGLVSAVSAGDASISATAPNGVSAAASLHVDAVVPAVFPDTRFSELHYDNGGVDAGEAIEIEGPSGTDLTGWSVVLYDGTPDLNTGLRRAYNSTVLSGTIPATCGDRGVVSLSYPSNGIQNGSPDGLALLDGSGAVVEFLSYEGTFTADDGPAAGKTSSDIIAAEASAALVQQSLQRDAFNRWALADRSFGACNSDGPGPASNSLSFSGRVPTDPALPVGFQDQLFATLRDPGNVVIPTTISWSSETPEQASIDSNGVMTALAEGTATLRATALDGTTATYSLPTRVATPSASAVYAGNAELGEPADADASDDFIVRYPEYTASFNPNKGTPNWVSYDLEVTHFGPEDRCDCFTFDPALPASFIRYTTADYTGAGAFHGFGIDRGHLARSFDRTSGSLDNARTFYFSNIVPQAADLNQGPWAIFENELGDFARFQDKEVYVSAGVAGSQGTLKNEGKLVIPASFWKVAVIMPRDHGLAQIADYRDLQVIAVNMPNAPGVRNVPWPTYLTTVDAVEALSGYDLLALLPDGTEAAVEANSQPPLTSVDGPYTSSEGAALSMSAAASLDPNGNIASYHWNFGDGTSATGPAVTHSYAQDGVYTVSVTTTDNDGLSDTIATTATVSNVAPTLAALANQTIQVGQSYTAAGSFTDPGADPWSASVAWGDGDLGSIPLADQAFSASHSYGAPGVFAVTLSLSDDDVTVSTSAVVTVVAAPSTLQDAIALVDELARSGKLARATALVLGRELALAQRELDRGHPRAALALLRGVINQLDLLVRLRRLSAADAAPLRSALTSVSAGL